MKGKPAHPLDVLLAVLVDAFDEETHPARTIPRPALANAEDHGQDHDRAAPTGPQSE